MLGQLRLGEAFGVISPLSFKWSSEGHGFEPRVGLVYFFMSIFIAN